MEERQLRMGVVLLAVLAVIVLLYWQWSPAEEELDPDATVPVWQVAAADITRVVVDRADGRVVLAASEGGWLIEEPIADLADRKQVEFLLEELERITKGVGIPDADPAEFGLADPPTVRVTVTLADGTTQTLDLGDEAPVGWRTYARAADGSVVAVAGVTGKRFQAKVDELRDGRVLRFDVAEVRRVVVEGPEGTLDVAGEGDAWWLAGWTRADPHKVEDLLTDLADVQFDEISEQDPAPDGIEDPTYRVTLELTSGTRELVVGDPAPLGTLVRSGSGRAGWVKADALKFLGRGPKDVGDATAFPLDLFDDEEIALVFGETTWTANRTPEDGWTAAGADAGPVLAVLVDVGIVYRPTPAPALTEAWGSVTATRGDVVRTVRIGQVVDADYRAAVDEAGGQPYRIPIEALDDVVAAISGEGAATAP